MEVFGTTLVNVYLFILILSSILTILFIFFGDFLDIFTGITPFLNPVLVLIFITFSSGSALLFELATSLSTISILVISIVIALILTFVLYSFVFEPIQSVENSSSSVEQTLKGKVGTVILSIPRDGFGEVMMDSKKGPILKPATSFDEKEIPEGQKALVVTVRNGVLYVVRYESKFENDSPS